MGLRLVRLGDGESGEGRGRREKVKRGRGSLYERSIASMDLRILL